MAAPAMPNYVYVIRQGASRRYKVGFTNNVPRRLKTLQTGNAEELRVVVAVKAPPGIKACKAEHTVHDYLRTKRVPGGGTEWFELSDAELGTVVRSLRGALEREETVAERVARMRAEMPDAPCTPPSRRHGDDAAAADRRAHRA